MPRLSWQLLLAAAAVIFRPVIALDNGVARTPPMGFNTWNAFGCDVHEDDVRELVDQLTSSGLKEAGYVYFNLDDCWSLSWRTAEGKLQADPYRFPSGIKALADYVHSKGLQFGIYADAGRFTCAGRAGSLGHELLDAQTFAGWGVDYLKYDNCGTDPGHEVVQRYTAMRDALNATGRPIVFSLWPAVGNSWRTSSDIGQAWYSVLYNLDSVIGLSMHAGPGAWNDPDMLQVGNSQHLLYRGRERVHFGMWALLKAPLLIGADLRRIGRSSLKLLKSPGALAINQDPMGVAGDLIFTHGSLQIFAAPLSGGRRAVALLNKSTKGQPTSMALLWSMLGYPSSLQAECKDAFSGAVLSNGTAHNLSVEVAPDDIALLVLRPLQEQLCSGKLHGVSADPASMIRSLSAPHVGGAAAGDCVELQSLDEWRPWHHGFFCLGRNSEKGSSCGGYD